MLHVRRRALIAVIGAGLALSATVGSVAASAPMNPGTYTATICYDAANVQFVFHQVWSGMEVDTVTGGEGNGKKGGFGFFNQLDTPATSGDETDTLLADPHSKTVGAEVFDQGASVGSLSINKIHGSWAKTLPAC